MRSLAGALLVVVVVAAGSSGCAVIGAKAPDPDRPRDQPPMCNDGKGGVVVDGLMATALGVITLAIASEGEGEAATITGLGALAYGISAGLGNSSARKCREAQEDFVARQESQEAEAAFARANVAAPGGMPIAPPEYEDQPVARPPQPAQPQAQAQAQPQPQPQPPAVARPAPRPTPARSDDDGGDDGDWSEFWKEVP
jgi:hypothetical protein